MNNINGFTFYKSYYECLTGLEQKDKEQILYAILEYVFEDKEPTFDDFKKTIWILIKPNLTTSKNKSNNAQKIAEEKQKEIKPKSNQNQIKINKKHSPQEEDKEEEDDKELDKEDINNKKENNKEKIFFENENVNNIFKDFLDIRKKLKAQNTDKAVKLLTNKLNKYDDDIKIKMIEQSIENSWKGLFEVKNNKSYQKTITDVPDWLGKEIKAEAPSDERKKEMEEILSKYK